MASVSISLLYLIIPSHVMETVQAGATAGYLVAVDYVLLLVVSLVGLTVVLERAWRLRRRRWLDPAAEERVERALQEGDLEQAAQACRVSDTVPNRVLADELDAWRSGRATLDDAIVTTEELSATEMHANMDLLATCAKIAPLLGLLGTVLGMMHSFSELDVGARKETLAQGITAALDTTVRGLIIAIFCLGFERAYLRRIAGLAARIDRFLREVRRTARGGVTQDGEAAAS